jgi:hypothetical protein
MIDETLHAFRMHLDHVRRMVADVPDSRMTAQPGPQKDHAAWTLGHLTYSTQAIGEELGIPPWLGPTWASFSPGSRPTPSASDYPKKAELLTALADGEARVAARLQSFGVGQLAMPLPDARRRDHLPSIGHAVVHILVGHTATHAGRLSVWRAALGLPPVAQPLDAEPALGKLRSAR